MMIKLTNKLYGASLIALAFSLNMADVNAQTCTAAPSCDTLGFTKSAKDCEGHSILKCPFDQTKFYCDSGASGGNSGGESNCAVGNILYSDKTCSVDPISSKTAIGVVFDASRGLAVALEQKQLAWSIEYFDVTGLPNFSNNNVNPENDYSGASNTASAIAYCRSNNKNCPAFEYVTSYSTRGTNIGDWYLPAFGELKTITNNKTAINATLGKIISATKLPSTYHWSSTENNDKVAMNIYISDINTTMQSREKIYEGSIRPVLAF